MKNFAVILLILLFCLNFISTGKAEILSHSVSFTLSDLKFSRFNNFDVITMKNLEVTAKIGYPQLPVQLIHLIIPLEAEVKRVEITKLETKVLTDKYNIQPVQQPVILSSPQGKKLKPTELTLHEVNKMTQMDQSRFAREEEMVEAFSDAWVFLALQNSWGITGQRLSTGVLANELKMYGWKNVEERLSGKLTQAVYQQYEFPRKVRYQTAEGGWKELDFET